MDSIKVVLADDHKIVLDGLAAILRQDADIEIVSMATNGGDAIQKVEELIPDVLILDIRLPDINGIEVTKMLNQKQCSTRVLLLTMHESREYVIGAIKAGAAGYILKDAGKDELISSIKTIAAGKKYYSSSISHFLADKLHDSLTESPHLNLLTKSETKILHLIEQGYTNKDIASILNKSIRTIETQRYSLMRKLDAGNVIELLNKAGELGILNQSKNL